MRRRYPRRARGLTFGKTMKTMIWIKDMHPAGFLAVDLRHVLAALGQDAVTSEWLAHDVWATGKGFAAFEGLPKGKLISGERLVALANDADQVIDGKFFGFRDGAVEPWIRIFADDSSLYEVETDDDAAKERILKSFKNTEMRKPNTASHGTSLPRRP